MLALLLLAGVFIAIFASELIVEGVAGGSLFGFFLAVAAGDFGAALVAVAILAACVWRWSSASAV